MFDKYFKTKIHGVIACVSERYMDTARLTVCTVGRGGIKPVILHDQIYLRKIEMSGILQEMEARRV